jgi:hypothetical protein
VPHGAVGRRDSAGSGSIRGARATSFARRANEEDHAANHYRPNCGLTSSASEVKARSLRTEAQSVTAKGSDTAELEARVSATRLNRL